MRKRYDFSKAKRNPYAKKLKKQITIRLDTDTLDYFKDLAAETGIPWTAGQEHGPQFASTTRRSAPDEAQRHHHHGALLPRCPPKQGFPAKATHRTRTGDLSFTKAPLYQLS